MEMQRQRAITKFMQFEMQEKRRKIEEFRRLKQDAYNQILEQQQQMKQQSELDSLRQGTLFNPAAQQH